MIDLLHPNPEELLDKWQHVIHQTKHVWTWTNEKELSWLAEYSTRCSNLIEIGSYNGRSAKVMLLANPKLHLVSLDTWDDGNLPVYQRNLAEEIAEHRVTFVQGASQDSFHIFKNRQIFDGCFIDGGHLEHLVAADIKNVMPLMRPGSIMAGHDYRTAEKNDVYRGVQSVIPNAVNPLESIWCHPL